jgi:hypothetical protein
MLSSTKATKFQLEIPYIQSGAKWRNMTCIVVNSARFQNLKIRQILSFLYSPEYNVSQVQNYAFS